MIKHLVMFQLKDFAEGLSKVENTSIIKEKLESLRDIIPEIQEMEVRVNHCSAPSSNYDLLLDTTFSSLRELKIYALHPAHLKVVEYISKVKKSRAAIDFEV